MAQEVELPDGSIAEFPDGMPTGDIEKALQQHYADSKPAAAPKEAPGFFSRVGADFNKRVGNDIEAIKAFKSGQLTVPGFDPTGMGQLSLQLLGKGGAGFVNDVATEALTSGFHALPDSAQGYIKDKAGAAANYIADSAVGRAGGKVIDAYQGFAKNNPNASRSLDAVANLAGALPATKAAGAASEAGGTVLRRTGETVAEHATNRALKARSAFVQDLISPHDTPTVRADQFGRAAEKGILKSRVVTPTAQEQAMIDVVSELPVSKNKSLLANHNIIDAANSNEAETLKRLLSKSNVQINPAEFQQRMQQAVKTLADNPLITGDAEKTASKVVEQFNKILATQPNTPAGLLEARKQLDRWVSRQRGEGIFDPARENAISAAVREIRQTANNFIAEKVPDAGVKESLAKQSNFYRAMENLRSKGAFEEPNALKRAAQKASNLIPVHNPYIKGALTTAGLGGAYLMGPAPFIAGAGMYGLGKAALNPKTEKAIGGLLKTTGKAMGGKGLLNR